MSTFEISTELYRRNAFRVLALASTANPRRARRQLGTLASLIDLGANEDLRGKIIGRFEKLPDESSLRAAAGRLEEPSQRIIDEIFWLTPSDAENTTLNHLNSRDVGDVRDAIEIWHDVEELSDQDSSRSARRNLAVIYHWLALEIERRIDEERPCGDEGLLRSMREAADRSWAQALRRWKHLSEDDKFWALYRSRAEKIGQERFFAEDVDRLRADFGQLVLGINAELHVSAARESNEIDQKRQRRAMEESGWPAATITSSLEAPVRPLLSALRHRLKELKTKIESDHRGAGSLALAEGREVEAELAGLEAATGKENDTARDLRELLASTLNRAMVAYTDLTEDNETGIELLKLAKRNAVSQETRKTIEGNLAEVSCFFCPSGKFAPRVKEKGLEVSIFKVTSFNRYSGSCEYSRATISVPRCAACARKSGQYGEARRHAAVQKHLQEGWHLGTEPTIDHLRSLM